MCTKRADEIKVIAICMKIVDKTKCMYVEKVKFLRTLPSFPFNPPSLLVSPLENFPLQTIAIYVNLVG